MPLFAKKANVGLVNFSTRIQPDRVVDSVRRCAADAVDWAIVCESVQLSTLEVGTDPSRRNRHGAVGHAASGLHRED